MEIGVGDFTVAPDVAATWLVERYPADTVRFYDYGTHEDLDSARSPRQRVVLEDLGRLACVGAGLTYDRAHTLLAASEEAPWPRQEVAPLTQVKEQGEDFYARADVDVLWHLFNYWTEKDNLGFGTVSKLMHLKWPHFVPITDDEFRTVYWARAVAKHNASDRICRDVGGRRRSRANVRAYWSAFHDDLLSSRPALDGLRENLRQRSGSGRGGPSDPHTNRLSGLTDVRLLDALVWGLGRNKGKLDR